MLSGRPNICGTGTWDGVGKGAPTAAVDDAAFDIAAGAQAGAGECVGHPDPAERGGAAPVLIWWLAKAPCCSASGMMSARCTTAVGLSRLLARFFAALLVPLPLLEG
mmetsp:Transcript_116921/g.325848  ORF Transcript_116921/g.325848 Transcript_116921/m.325848 type:complete len:107 (-) Transcript_116921:590-910(-)